MFSACNSYKKQTGQAHFFITVKWALKIIKWNKFYVLWSGTAVLLNYKKSAEIQNIQLGMQNTKCSDFKYNISEYYISELLIVYQKSCPFKILLNQS